IGLKERLLHHILAVHDRPGHACAVAMQIGTKVRDGFEERDIPGLERARSVYTSRSIHIGVTQPLTLRIRGSPSAFSKRNFVIGSFRCDKRSRKSFGGLKS